MTQTKHTPGPWYWWDENSPNPRPQNYDLAALYGANGVKISGSWYGGAGIFALGKTKEDIANARLIAAAPETAAERDSLQILAGDRLIEIQKLTEINTELLEALKKANALVKAAFEHHTGVWKAADDVIDISDAAIAKATGQVT